MPSSVRFEIPPPPGTRASTTKYAGETAMATPRSPESSSRSATVRSVPPPSVAVADSSKASVTTASTSR